MAYHSFDLMFKRFMPLPSETSIRAYWPKKRLTEKEETREILSVSS